MARRDPRADAVAPGSSSTRLSIGGPRAPSRTRGARPVVAKRLEAARLRSSPYVRARARCRTPTTSALERRWRGTGCTRGQARSGSLRRSKASSLSRSPTRVPPPAAANTVRPSSASLPRACLSEQVDHEVGDRVGRQHDLVAPGRQVDLALRPAQPPSQSLLESLERGRRRSRRRPNLPRPTARRRPPLHELELAGRLGVAQPRSPSRSRGRPSTSVLGEAGEHGARPSSARSKAPAEPGQDTSRGPARSVSAGGLARTLASAAAPSSSGAASSAGEAAGGICLGRAQQVRDVGGAAPRRDTDRRPRRGLCDADRR